MGISKTKALFQVIKYVGVLAVGATGGIIFEHQRNKSKNKPCGVLRIDNSDPDIPENFFLELEMAPSNLNDGDVAQFVVVRKNYISNNEEK